MYGGMVYPDKTLPAFAVREGCMYYIGDVTLDFTGIKPVIGFKPPTAGTLDEFKNRYPKMFAAYSVCQ